MGLACLLARARGAEALASDKVTLKDGKVVEGEVLDLTEKKVVVAAGKDGKERKTYSRAQVASIERSAPENVLQLCERKLKSLAGSKSLEDWKGLALFCEKQKLHPERRRALREILKIDPENREARLALGHASLDGRWLDEDEVELKLKEGFELADGKLVRKTSTTTVAKVDAPPDRYVILEGQKLSPAARKKLDKERETRLKSADRFLAGKEKEYAGVPWSERHKIQTRFFEIHCNSTRKVADAYGLLMEMIRAKLSEMFQSEIKRNFRAPVFIYSSQEEFMSQDQLGRWMGRGLGGYYNPATQAITAFHGTFGFTGTT
ncbi:MAG: hypothetical protein HY721_17670, partial [Planctomycetes bacterium]|nr:hypothetical protein [Planctomycetota bacterium]